MDIYPLLEKIPEHIKSKTGKAVTDITLDNVLNGDITSEDIKISKETLLLQAEVARSNGRPQIAKNLVRAAELIDVPDDEILKMYDLLRPYRATEQELIEIANRLQNHYGAEVCAGFIFEAISVYKKRDLLKK